MPRPAHRTTLVLVALCAWLLPAGAAFLLTLHVAFDHHGPVDPAQAVGVVHGHPHLDGEGEHGHDAFASPVPAPRSGITVLGTAPRTGEPPPLQRTAIDPSPPSSRGSPLHQKLCVLLL